MRASPLLVVFVLAAACGDGDGQLDAGRVDGGPLADARPDIGATDTGPLPDTGPTPDGGPGLDAEPGDAPVIDGFVMDAEPLDPVIVRSAAPGGPLTVVFQDPAGDVISTRTTTMGEAREIVPAGGMVTVAPTVFTGNGVHHELHVVAGVEPGDVYTYRVPEVVSDIIGDLSVTLPGLFSGAASYVYDFGCGDYYAADPTMPELATVFSNCTGSASAEIAVLATARDVNDQIVAYSVLDAVALIEGGTATAVLPAWQTTFDMPDVTLQNPPAEASDAYLTRAIRRRTATYLQRDRSLALSSGGGTVSFTSPQFGDSLLLAVGLPYAGGSSYLFTNDVGRGPITIDLGAELLPLLSAAVSSTVADPARPRLHWTPAAADGLVIRMVDRETGVTWMIALDPSAGSFRLPELPDELELLRPEAASTFDVYATLVDSSGLADHRAFRLAAGLHVDVGGELRRSLPAGVRVRLSEYPVEDLD